MIPLAELGVVLWLGILTSISPCPMATNIAAISYLGKQVDKKTAALWTGLLYTLGRTVTYMILGFVLVSSTQAIPSISIFLQKYMSLIIGPVLIIIGLVLLNIIHFTASNGTLQLKMQNHLNGKGYGGAFLLGLIFALSFCPVSAALFFGNTLAVAVKFNSGLLVPGLYGIGTALPVVIFAVILVFSVNTVGMLFKKLTIFEKYARPVSGVIFAAAGIYYLVQHFLP